MVKQKRYILKGVVNGISDKLDGTIEKNLLNLSSIGIKINSSLTRHMRGIGISQQNDDVNSYSVFNMEENSIKPYFNTSIAGQNDYIAFFDKTYEQRRDFLRKFALQGEIDFITDTISDDTIVYDENGYFAYPDTKQIAARLKKSKESKDIIDAINESFRRVYSAYHFNESHDAWNLFKKFLVEGIISFEIIYDNDKKSNKATSIKGFQELDPVTLEPAIIKDNNGNEIKVWYQNKGDASKERIIPDSNIVYISWTKANHISRISYVERLVRSFNMLRTLENSRIIWNLQNAQKRLKFVIPIGTQNEAKARMRLDMLKNEYKEDVLIDDLSGEIVVNGQPKFSFAKNYFFPSNDSGSTDISEVNVAGHDLSNTDQLKFFWQMFMLETKIPFSRFGERFGINSSNEGIRGVDVISREEYDFSLFIKRCRNIFQELLVKPTWMQFCLKYPQFATNDILKSSFGIVYVEENIFTLAKERKIMSDGASIINELSNIQKSDGSPFFSIKFLCQKFLGMSEDDYKLNEKYLEEEKSNEEELQSQKHGTGGLGGSHGRNFGNDFGNDFGEDEFETNEEPTIESEPSFNDEEIGELQDTFNSGELE